MSQQKHDELPRGPIHRHMHHTDNPIASIDSKLWDCPDMHSFKKMDRFFETFHKESQCLLAEGGQSNIYTFISTDARSGRSKLSIAKCYDIAKKSNAFASIWTEFVLVKEARLLIYDDIYYDEREQKAIIVSEPLNYTLRDYVEIQMKHRDISEYECKMIILDIMDKLWTTHRCGFIHNDLTPDNIMYRNGDFRQLQSETDGHRWQIIDYGLMLNQTDAKTHTYRYKGTRGWTSPETVPESNENVYSFANDIWSLGLIIIYILCKKQPYTLTGYEQTVLCRKDRDQYKQYFYYNKLLQRPFQRRNKLKAFIRKQLKQTVAAGHVEAGHVDRLGRNNNNNNKKAGQLYLKKYLRQLWENKKISSDLCSLLANYMLHFDPAKRFNCAQIYKHKWFDDVRHL